MVTAGPGQKPECWCPSSIKTSPYWWTMDVGLKVLPFGLPQIRSRGMEGGEFSFFFLTSASDVKKLNSPLSVPRHRICGDLEGNNFNTGVHPLLITGSFDGRRHSGFSPSPPVTILRSHGSGFFNVSGHTMVSQTGFLFCHFFDVGRQWPYHGSSLWDCGMVIDVQV